MDPARPPSSGRAPGPKWDTVRADEDRSRGMTAGRSPRATAAGKIYCSLPSRPRADRALCPLPGSATDQGSISSASKRLARRKSEVVRATPVRHDHSWLRQRWWAGSLQQARVLLRERPGPRPRPDRQRRHYASRPEFLARTRRHGVVPSERCSSRCRGRRPHLILGGSSNYGRRSPSRLRARDDADCPTRALPGLAEFLAVARSLDPGPHYLSDTSSPFALRAARMTTDARPARVTSWPPARAGINLGVPRTCGPCSRSGHEETDLLTSFVLLASPRVLREPHPLWAVVEGLLQAAGMRPSPAVTLAPQPGEKDTFGVIVLKASLSKYTLRSLYPSRTSDRRRRSGQGARNIATRDGIRAMGLG